MKNLRILLISLLFIACGGGSDDDETPIDDSTNCPLVGLETGECPTGDFSTLVWEEEFDGSSIDASTWSFEMGDGCPDLCGWGNNEAQYYTNRSDNARVEDGILKITAKRESLGNRDYTSARMISKGKFEFQYGRVEIRAKLPQGQGTWPALWLLGGNIDQVGWPRCGEIDIMEHGDGPNGLVSSSVHLPNANGDHYYVRGDQRINNESSEFHVYRMDWYESRIQFYVDEIRHHNFTLNEDMPFHQPFFFILNIAMGGSFTGNNIDVDFVSSQMEIDYIRLYK
jgi:beta-glucanase (GH16 family)